MSDNRTYYVLCLAFLNRQKYYALETVLNTSVSLSYWVNAFIHVERVCCIIDNLLLYLYTLIRSRKIWGRKAPIVTLLRKADTYICVSASF